jgi:RimJ/RimL family protein N-acetyltransferase
MSPPTDAASAFPVIETPRLLLRVPALGDFERYAEAMADPEASRHIGGVMVRAAAWRRFLQMPGAWLVQGFAMFSVIDRADGRWLGQAGPWHPDGWNGTEVGYSFHPDAWGRGLASEAVQATIDFAFGVLGWDEVIHNIAPANLASQRLALRVGSRCRGPGRLPEPFADAEVEIWGQTRAEWAAARA